MAVLLLSVDVQLMREDIACAFSQLDTERPLAEVVYELDLFLCMMKAAHEHIVNVFGIPVSVTLPRTGGYSHP